MSDLSKLEIGRLEAENERLREALEKLVSCVDDYDDLGFVEVHNIHAKDIDRANKALAVTQ